jgi:hypothetical protein
MHQRRWTLLAGIDHAGTVATMRPSPQIRITAAALLLLFAAAVLLLPRNSASDDPYSARVMDCVELPGSDWVVSSEKIDCYQRLWLAALSAGEEDLLRDTLGLRLPARSADVDACHLGGHRAGLSWFTTVEAAAETLANAHRYACEFGLEHGLLEGAARSAISDEEFALLSSACTTLPNGSNARSLCVDGSGHAIWYLATDLERSVTSCLGYQLNADRADCLGGVIMQMFRGDIFGEGLLKRVPTGEGVEQVRNLCEHARRMADDDTASGCYLTSSHPLQLQLVGPVHDWVRAVQSGADPETSARRIAEPVATAARRCRDYAPEHASCLDGLIAWFATSTGGDPTLLAVLCGLLNDPGQHSRCRSTHRL